jgi:D-glycero-beta-D-manno-heptose-7-phosphate kinase
MSAPEILQRLESQRVLIVGDVMLDRYLTGAVSRISPEAPVPVVLHQHTYDRLGGAANVALNIRALGSQPILCSVVGDDTDGAIFQQTLHAQGISAEGIVRSASRRTTVKTRVLGNNQQMLRIDREDTHGLAPEEENGLLDRYLGLLDAHPVQAVILQDYNKGVLTPAVIEAVIGAARERDILTAVDPKRANFFAYRGVTLFKPNLKEIRDSAPFGVSAEPGSLRQAAAFLREQLGNSLTMITLSEKGLYLDDGASGTLHPTIPRNVADVSGAGDTVISIAALALAAGLDLGTVAALSNLAGGQVCESPGVVSVERGVLERELGEWLG